MNLKTSTSLCTSLVALVLLLCFCCNSALAQTLQLKGKITDENGQGLPGASVIIKGTTDGTTTDVNGNYILVSNPSSDVLVISYMGYLPQEIKVGSRDIINVALAANTKQLNEVVVTALGIEREKKALGYAVTEVSGEELTSARSNNFVSALSGKVAGLNLTTPGSGPINSTRVTLRGDNSLDPNKNAALVVLDGVPMSSGLTSSGVGNAYGAGSGNDVPVDFGNGIADINPDDIESITVLKGPAAAALYGSRASNGAMIITTKSGARNKKGIGVTVNTNVSFQDVLRWPDYQYEYGQGTATKNKDGELYYSYGVTDDGASTSGTSSAFGPKFDGQYYYQYDPELEGASAERRLWQPYKDNRKGFWRTGSTFTNSVSLEGGNEFGSVRASVTHSKNEWIMPNTGFERMTAALSVNYNVSDKLKVSSKVNFTHKQSDNLPATGYNNQSIAYFMIFQNPNVDLAWYEPKWKKGQEQIEQVHPFSSFIDNPYLIAYEMTNSLNNYSTVGNLAATYQITPKLDLMVRSGIDMTDEDRQQRRPYSTANFKQGYYREQNIFDFEINTDALLTYQEDLSERFSFRASVGANKMARKYSDVAGYVDGLGIPGVYKLSNGINNPMMSTNYNNKFVNSLYGFGSLSFDDKIFVDITGRNDWSSTLPVQNNSFFYPSISTSFILSDLLPLPRRIDYAKARLSVAQVGNDTDPYKTQLYYDKSEFGGSAMYPTTLHNTDFKPEITTSYEAGLEFLLFKGRIGADVAVYRNFTKNQILDVPFDWSTGVSRAVLNAGEVKNQGVELALNFKPIDKANLTWKTTAIWSKNDNEVLELAEGLTDQQIIGVGGNATLIAKVGGSTGDIYGFGFERAPDGQIIYTSAGLPKRPQEIQYIGNAYADWKGGFLNEVTVKNFRFSVLLDGQYGGIVYSQTHHKMSEQGKLEHTLKGREDGFIIGEGVVENSDGTFSPNTKQVALPTFYADYYRRANVESNSFDASFLKLREVRLEYNLPKAFLSRTRVVSGATIGLYGRDLAMISDFPIYDPETAALNGSTILPGIEMGQMPSTRTYGMNVTLNF